MHTSLIAVSHALIAATPAKKNGSSIIPFIVLLALFGVAYFLFLRPARNRQRAQVQAKRSVEVGDEVTTTAGLIATVIEVHDDMLLLEVAPGVQCRYVPAAILRVNTVEDESNSDKDEPEPLDASTHEVIESPPESTDGSPEKPDDAHPA